MTERSKDRIAGDVAAASGIPLIPFEPIRLAAVEAIHVRVPLRRPLLDATGEYTHRRTWLLRLRDAAGIEGVGEAALHPAADDVATDALARLMRSLVDGLAAMDPRADAIAGFQAALPAEGVPGRAALAGLDAALAALRLAAASRRLEESGSPHAPARVPVAASIPFGGAEAGAAAAAQALELGFGTLELRAGYERQTEHLVERLRAIRQAVGPEPRLRIDAAGAWDLDTATDRILAAEPFLLEYVEQPLPAWDLSGAAALRERVAVPIALDEAIDSEGTARAALMEGAADVLVVKPVRVGGGSAALRIAEASAARGVPVVIATLFETGVGIAAGLRTAAALPDGATSGRAGARPAHMLATAGVLGHDLLRVPLAIEQGRMAVPASVELDEAEVGRRAVERVGPR